LRRAIVPARLALAMLTSDVRRQTGAGIAIEVDLSSSGISMIAITERLVAAAGGTRRLVAGAP